MLYTILKHVIWILRIYNLFREIFEFRDFKKAFMNFRNLLLLIFSPYVNISRNKLYVLILHITFFKMIYNISKFQEFEFFSNFKKWPKFDNFPKIAHKIAKSKYFVDI